MNAKAGTVKSDYQQGRSLPRHFYCDPRIFETDMRFLGETQWLLVDHSSRIPQPGDYFVFRCGNENVIVLRDRDRAVRAFYNVCRHRGSLICLESSGHVKALTCPYHAWTYDLTGRLIGASSMPPDFDKHAHSLRPVHVQVESGLIFVNLADGSPPSFETFFARHRPFLAPHDFGSAKVAIQRHYPTQANWKLVVENFLECYHCKPAHPTYCSVHSAEKLLALGAGPGSSAGDLAARFESELERWERAARTAGQVTGMFGDGVDAPYFQGSGRMPIKQGYLTESINGTPVAPLMGTYTAYDGGQTAIGFNPISYVMASNDYAVMFLFAPRGPRATDVIATWLVSSNAQAGRDYDEDRLTAVWDITLKEDKTITENNQLGVMSRHYVPGVHSLHEKRISDFVVWYMTHRDTESGERSAGENHVRPGS
jgi:phenylpropionate dioxygenase-like ring-hydroxylating dioxygenase large terminal subunit